jgi:hypothetical protein
MKLLLGMTGTMVAMILLVVVIGTLLPKTHIVFRSALFKTTPEQLFELIDGPKRGAATSRRMKPSPFRTDAGCGGKRMTTGRLSGTRQ